MSHSRQSPAQINASTQDFLPGHLGIVITETEEGRCSGEMAVKKHHLAPNGYMHAGSVVTLADSCCGLGCVNNLPEGAAGFTTIELKSNHLGTALEGTVACKATLFHGGRTTQVWDAEVIHKETGKTMALFRCTQLILYKK